MFTFTNGFYVKATENIIIFETVIFQEGLTLIKKQCPNFEKIIMKVKKKVRRQCRIYKSTKQPLKR